MSEMYSFGPQVKLQSMRKFTVSPNRNTVWHNQDALKVMHVLFFTWWKLVLCVTYHHMMKCDLPWIRNNLTARTWVLFSSRTMQHCTVIMTSKAYCRPPYFLHLSSCHCLLNAGVKKELQICQSPSANAINNAILHHYTICAGGYSLPHWWQKHNELGTLQHITSINYQFQCINSVY